MDATRLTWPLVLEEKSLVPDSSGGQSEVWVQKGTLWCELLPKSGRELEGEAASISRSLWTITVRASPIGSASRPVAGHRFRQRGRLFGILAVQEADRQARWLRCTAEEERVT